MPPKGAKRLNATQHGANGLAQPGKKIDKLSRQKPNGHINGSARSPSAAKPQRPVTLQASVTSSDELLADAHTSQGPAARPRSLRWDDDQGYDGDSREELEGNARAPSLDSDRQLPRRIDINAPGNPAVHHESGPLHLASSILRGCALADTLAILIILLQTPSAFLTVVQFLFVMLTLVPTSGSSAPVRLSLGEMFQGAAGTPSLATIAISDMVCFAVWLFLWTPVQSILLDCAQAVIALSLGGRFGGKNRGPRNGVMCVGIVVLSHYARSKFFRHPVSNCSLPVGRASLLLSDPLLSELRYPASNSRQSWIRSMMAVHILTQGILRTVRRWLFTQELGGASSSIRKADLDSASLIKGPAGNHTNIDVLLEAGGGSSAETQISPLVPLLKDGKEKAPSGKKRRKQGANVRSYQPLWAALASTKAILLKEFERSHASADAAGAKATDINYLGDAPFTSEDSRVWVVRVDSTSIFFQSSFFDPLVPLAESATRTDVPDRNSSLVADRSKPFYVRVNGTEWPSTRIRELETDPTDTKRGCWSAEIYGLAPGSSYTCEFVRSSDHVRICSTNLTTPQPSTAESASPGPSSSKQTPLRPSSPTTTLRSSLAAAEAKLDEERASLKKSRKEHKSQLASIKKELDGYSSRFASAGSGDDRHRQRLLQIGQNIRQAEDAAALVSSQAAAMGPVSEDDLCDWKRKGESRSAMQRSLSEAQADLTDCAAASERQLAAVQSEAAHVQQKRERVQARHAKLKTQHDRLSDTTVPDPEELERRAALQAAKADERQSIEHHYMGQVKNLHQTLQDIQLGGQQLWQQVHCIENAYRDQQQRLLANAPGTPESMLPGALASGTPSTLNRFGSATFPTLMPHFSLSQAQAPPSRSTSMYREGRVRSSSMLSSMSGFTDFVDAPGLPYDLAAASIRHGDNDTPSSEGDVSAGRSRSGSQRDLSSPFPKSASPLTRGKGGSPIWR